jgi:hypothetical protein
MLELPHFTFADTLWSRISKGAFFRGFLGAPALIRTTLEQIRLREILLLRGILG